MREVTFSMSMSLDGFITDPDGGLDWSGPADDVMELALEEILGVGVHLMGRRLYETMLFWETADPAELDEAEQEWVRRWNPLPKVVFSSTLDPDELVGNARLATGSVAEEIDRLRATSEEGEIAIGGAVLAAQAAAVDLIDEYRVRVHPVLLGGGVPFFAPEGRRVALELVDSRAFDTGMMSLRYRVPR